MIGADGQIFVGAAVNAPFGAFGGVAVGRIVVKMSAVAMLDGTCVSDDVHIRL